MNSKLENGTLTIYLSGNIDSNNADAAEKEITSFQQQPFDALILNCGDLKYISSAGLRVILRQKKLHKDLKITECSPEIYDIFDMTGFTEMITIEKAYRQMSVDNCEIIGEGSNGIVYRYNDDTIIKVYKNPDCLEDITRERELAKKALVLGINTAISYDVVKVGDKYGSVFEMLTAKSITKLILAQPEKMDEYVKVTTDLLRQIHDTVANNLPDNKAITLQREEYLKDYLDEADYKRLVELTEAIPASEHLIHGDYHTSNVHYDGKEALLIDMDTLSVGNPVFEFASIYLAYVGFGELDPDVIGRFMKISAETAKEIWKKTLRYYFDTEDPAILAQQEDKARVLGYMRLMRRTIKRISKDDPMVEHCRKNLHELLQRVDSLAM